MNKTVIMTCMIIFATIGDCLPMLFGNFDLLSLWSILGGMIGGFIGIWVGVVISKKYF